MPTVTIPMMAIGGTGLGVIEVEVTEVPGPDEEVRVYPTTPDPVYGYTIVRARLNPSAPVQPAHTMHIIGYVEHQ